jgi:hypothetical protein
MYMPINAHIDYGTISMAMENCRQVMRMRPVGNQHSALRIDGSNKLFIKPNWSGDHGS